MVLHKCKTTTQRQERGNRRQVVPRDCICCSVLEIAQSSVQTFRWGRWSANITVRHEHRHTTHSRNPQQCTVSIPIGGYIAGARIQFSWWRKAVGSFLLGSRWSSSPDRWCDRRVALVTRVRPEQWRLLGKSHTQRGPPRSERDVLRGMQRVAPAGPRPRAKDALPSHPTNVPSPWQLENTRTRASCPTVARQPVFVETADAMVRCTIPVLFASGRV